LPCSSRAERHRSRAFENRPRSAASQRKATRNYFMTNKLLIAVFIATVSLSYFSPSTICAQSLPPAHQDGVINAVIVSNSGKERRLNGHNGYIGRAGLRPRQSVRVTLEFTDARADSAVVSALDGGEIVGANAPLRINRDGTASFIFREAEHPGLYRVIVEAGAQRSLLEFYVLDIEHPKNNPPRVRIVD
jgi:hypothetical protein